MNEDFGRYLCRQRFLLENMQTRDNNPEKSFTKKKQSNIQLVLIQYSLNVHLMTCNHE